MPSVNVKIVRSDEFSREKWSGGVTTQLAIWPEDGDYAARRFDWRISSASIEEDESTFTFLPGVRRRLMLIAGGAEIFHDGGEGRLMIPFADVDEFDGGRPTRSEGRCADFNLMTADGYDGAIYAVPAGKRISLPTPADAKQCWHGIYAVADGVSLELECGGRFARLTLGGGDFLLVSYAPQTEISFVVEDSYPSFPAVAACVVKL